MKTMMLVFAVALLLGFTAQTSRAQEQVEFATVAAFLKQTLTSADSLSVDAKGDLNGDGLEDWSGLILRGNTGPSQTSQLYVLLQQAHGGYRVAEKSRAEAISGMGCCWTEDVRINRSSVYIQNNAKTAPTMEAATHQFKFYRNEWRLIGVKIYYINFITDISTEKDMNLLTGLVIEKRWKSDKNLTTKRSKKKFGRFLLKDFDFSHGFGVEVTNPTESR